MGPAANCSLEGEGHASFLPVRAPAVALEVWPHLGQVAAGPCRPWSAMAIGQPAAWRGRAKGEKASPLAIPGLEFRPTAGKAPSCGLPFTGREPHAIHGVTLPLTVILTVHRLHATRHSARQTARTWAIHS